MRLDAGKTILILFILRLFHKGKRLALASEKGKC